MGGNAFNLLHPEAKFPRMKPGVYEHLKSKFHGALQGLYTNVATPYEAPEKLDHGDIDFIVHGPRTGLLHEDIERALGSKWSVPAKGDHGTGNFAIPTSSFGNLVNAAEDEYYQVDVHVCPHEGDFHKVVFFHGYGDLGMILGLMTRSAGLAVNHHGLRLGRPLPTYPPISLPLSSSFDEIMPFFGLSMERWKQGFATRREVFDWVASSPYFDAHRMARSEANHLGRRKAREVRGMYQDFIAYANDLASKSHTNPQNQLTREEIQDTTQEAALVFFRKKELYDKLLDVAKVKQQVKTVFTGKLVMQWTGLVGLPVRWVMDEVKKRLGGEGPSVGSESPSLTDQLANLSVAGAEHRPAAEETSIRPTHLTLAVWERSLEGMSIEDVEALVIQVKQELYDNGELEHNWREKQKLKSQRKSALAG